MPLPWSFLSPTARRVLFAATTVLLIAVSAILLNLDVSLRTDASPRGIVDFELAGTADRAAAILDAWSPAAREIAMFIQGIDSLYLVLYPVWLSIACAGAARDRVGGIATTGTVMSWLVLAAAPLDAVENWAMVEQILGGPDASRAALARACAIPKFALAALALGSLAAMGVARLRRS